MALSHCETTWAAENTVDVTNVTELRNAFASTTISGKTTINIKNDLDFTGVTWDPSSFSAAAIVVIDGGTGVTLSNLTSPLIKACGVGQAVTIKNVTIDKANINGDSFALAAFIGNADNSSNHTFENCKLTNSSVTNTSGYAGGFVGYASAGSSDPRTITFTNCQVLNCQIEGGNSTGGLMGHAIGNANLSVVVNNATVKDNTITCNDDSQVKAGSLLGTVGAGSIEVSANVSGNTVKSGDSTTGVATITTIYGRQGDSAADLTLTGGSYDSAPLGASDTWASYGTDTPVATDEDDNYYVGSDSIAAAANSGTTVTVIKGGAINGLQPGATVGE